MNRNFTEEMIIKEEIAVYGFGDLQKDLFNTCIQATNCIYTASEIVAEEKYNEYIPLIFSYIELADNLVYKYQKGYKYNATFIVGLIRLLSSIKENNGAYEAEPLEEARIKTYLNSYGWIVSEDESIAINLDMDYLDFTNDFISA